MKKTGFFLIVCSVLLFLLDRFTSLLSGALGKLICGAEYMRPVNGVICGKSCGFNMDLYVTVFLMGLLLAGVFLFLGEFQACKKKCSKIFSG